MYLKTITNSHHITLPYITITSPHHHTTHMITTITTHHQHFTIILFHHTTLATPSHLPHSITILHRTPHPRRSPASPEHPR
ncbi:hypothetical protein E2C01_083432 [Portunus trituberculatus]|uniref:Uncharacterized protein n=1 Tax=Portunus trituberculatus TaxID=210409 RepID=A0A5B7J3H0_PORTR|nr:hypothetical protein [Portunus trituberculatus]